VDVDDFNRFFATYGRVAGDPLFNVCADYDGNGVIGLGDYAGWYACYIAYVTGQ